MTGLKQYGEMLLTSFSVYYRISSDGLCAVLILNEEMKEQ